MKFLVVFSGSSAVERVQYETSGKDLNSAVASVSIKLGHHFPVYWWAGIYDEAGVLLKELTAKVVVD